MNRIVKAAILASHDQLKPRKPINYKTIREWWDRVGRPDLADLPETQLPCTYLEALHIAQKELKRSNQ